MVAWLRLSRSQRLTATPLLDPGPTAVGRSISKKECVTRARSATLLAHVTQPRHSHPSAPCPSTKAARVQFTSHKVSRKTGRGGWGAKILDFLLYYRHRCERFLAHGPSFAAFPPQVQNPHAEAPRAGVSRGDLSGFCTDNDLEMSCQSVDLSGHS